ncbi:testis-specific gene A8 protein-like [Schistocerca nitens]|uniref:testis-specific gene A8 protein-like n=1 Tax=Schistocerca nitens TaxID=7011 RepID=UPI00211985A1|nr:testis-specific gene A8 protein-like [Schistocerca nitens]
MSRRVRTAAPVTRNNGKQTAALSAAATSGLLQAPSSAAAATLLVLDATGRRDPRTEASSPDAASTAAEWAPDKALRCQTPWGCPRKAAAGQAAEPPLGKAARLRGRRPSAPKAVATEEGPQAPEQPPGALPDEAAREASTGRAVGVVAATAAAAALGAAAKSEGAAGTRRGPNLWTKNERQNPGGQRGATGSDASCAPQ